MARRTFAREFNLEAVKLVRERGMTVAQAARDLGVHGNVLRRWERECAADAQQAFPGQGQMQSDQLEIERLRREVTKLKAERDILKKAQRPTSRRSRCEVRVHREAPGSWPTAWLCEALGVSRGGFYAWLTRPRSPCARRDEVLGAKVRTSFLQSDRTYGARRVWHDLQAEGEVCGLHRIERLMRHQALRARPR